MIRFVPTEEHSYINAPMSYTDFSGITIVGADFTGAHLDLCNFKGAKLQDCKFNGAYLTEGDYSGCIFENCEMIGTNLHSSDLTDACFNNSDLLGATLTNVTLNGTSFYKTRLTDIRGMKYFGPMPNGETMYIVNRLTDWMFAIGQHWGGYVATKEYVADIDADYCKIIQAVRIIMRDSP